MLILLPYEITAWGLIWLLGATIAVYACRGAPLPSLWVAVPMFLLLVAITRATHSGGLDAAFSRWRFFIDLATALAYAVLLLAFYRPGVRMRLHAAHRVLADFSYSLYLVHFTLVIFVAAALGEWANLPILSQPDASNAVRYVVVLGGVVAAAWAFSRATEAHTSAVRRWLMRSRATKAAASAA